MSSDIDLAVDTFNTDKSNDRNYLTPQPLNNKIKERKEKEKNHILYIYDKNLIKYSFSHPQWENQPFHLNH